MLLQKSTLLQVAGALATTQSTRHDSAFCISLCTNEIAARAAPHPGSPTLLVRDDALPTAGGVYGFYGINEHPLISDLEFGKPDQLMDKLRTNPLASVLPLIEDEAGAFAVVQG